MPTVESILLEKGSDVIGVGADATVRQAVRKMVESDVGCLIVEQDARVVGVFTERDLLRRVVDAGKDPDATGISEVMTTPVHSCKPSDDVGGCFDKLRIQQYRHLLVLDNDEPVGVISLRDVALLLCRPA
jgi:CBS domain-containing protein